MATLRGKRRVHQYHSGTAKGDAVTNGMLYARSLLREMGFESEIFCSHPDPLLGAEVLHISRWDGSADALLVHHSMGIDDERWLTEVDCKKILVYHNITPAEFFSNQPLLGEYARRGIEQARRWRPTFAAVVADSEQNKLDLVELGYPAPEIDVLPLLVDLDTMRRIVPSEHVIREHEKYFNVLFVGRLAENKCQHEVVRAYARTRTCRLRPSRLVLVGGTTSEEYVATVKAEADRLGIADELVVMGKVSDEDLAAAYRAAGVFVCLSRHEGFGVPLVEAMLYDVPIVALAAAAVPWTVGRGGILFDRLDHDEVAVAIDFLAEDALLRAKLAVQQRRELTRFDRAAIGAQLAGVLAKIGLAAPQPIEARRAALGGWRVEGPFDSTYSLAILNRNLGRALARQDVEVEYKSTEGPGDFAPGAEFLRANADIAARLAGGDRPRPLVTMRNLYPPRCSGFEGAVNGFALYGWEESNFPKEWVEDFNRSLGYVTTMSEYVRRTLINNGVRVPVRTVGVGVDHFARVQSEPLPLRLPDGFRFLHNSSCFPRKGVDVLLKAFAREFSGLSDVCLVIKTFPNPHNEIEQQIEHVRAQFPAAPPIRLIMDPLTDGQMRALYTNCHALVAPSRGEGFGLPLAEAMLCGIPVVTTAHGGQREFCTGETAWLVDYTFAYSQTHFGLAGSVWAEPDAESLAAAMRDVVDGDPRLREARVARARELVFSRFSWDAVARRQIDAVTDIVEHAPISAGREMHIAWVSTWKTRCGIAAYSQYLTANWDRASFTVLADEQPGGAAEEKVVRCWRQGAADTGERILAEVSRLAADAVVVQYNFGFFPLAALARIIDALAERGKIVVVVFHATKDVDKPDFKASLREIKGSLGRCSRILVHSVADCNHLKQMGLVDNVMLFPHGIPDVSPRRRPDRSSLPFTVATFGYALPHKGMREVIEACGLLRDRGRKLALRMYNARYPIRESDEEIAACKALIRTRLLDVDATFEDGFQGEHEIQSKLADADLVVFAYQRTDESSSAAVRAALASGARILCTPLPIFEDVAIGVNFAEGIASFQLADAIVDFMQSADAGKRQLERREKWLQGVAWPVIAKRLNNVLYSLQANQAGFELHGRHP